MTPSTTLDDRLAGAADASERSSILIQATAEALVHLNEQHRWIEGQLYGQHGPAELRKLLEGYAQCEAKRAECLSAIREWRE